MGRAALDGEGANRLLTRAHAINWEIAVYIVIFTIAIFTRFVGLGDRVMSHDESLHTYYSYLLYRDGNFQHTPLMHGPILFHAVAFSYFLFGDNDFTARIYPAILGVMMVMFPLLMWRWLGRWGAIIASIGILISPLLLYHHRYIREDTPAIMASLIMVWATFQYIDGAANVRRKTRWLVIFAAALLWNLGSKETAFMYVAIFGSFLTIYWIARLLQHFFKLPGRTIFYTIILAMATAGVAALVMYGVIAITLHGQPTLEERTAFIAQQFSLFVGGTATDAAGIPQTLSRDFTTFVVWTALTATGVVALVVGAAIWVAARGGRIRAREILILLTLVLALCIVLIVVEELSFISSRLLTAEPAVPEAGDSIATTGTVSLVPLVGAYIVAFVVIAGLIYSRIAGWWRTLSRFAELDVLIVFGALILPWLTPFLIKLMGASPTDYTSEGIQRAVLALIPMMAIAFATGLIWNWKRFLLSAAVFYVLFVFFFTTMFTNPLGLATGMIGSLGYWLQEQGTRRGSQPQYYYTLIVMPFYEFLPMIGSFIAMLGGYVAFWRYRSDRITARAARDESPQLSEVMGTDANADEIVATRADDADAEIERRVAAARADTRALDADGRLKRLSFPLFVGYWAVFIVVALTLAGEKMPWLVTHMTAPMILLTGWWLGGIVEKIDWQALRQRGWIYLLLFPLMLIVLFQIVSPFLVGQSPFAGLEQPQLADLNFWIGMVALSIALGLVAYRIMQRVGVRHMRQLFVVAIFGVLTLLTVRSAWMATYINYDYANEFLVYAHGAPGIKQMRDQIEELSQRTSEGMDFRFAWGGNAWPTTWYFRDLSNAAFFGQNPSFQLLDGAIAVYASGDIRSRVEPLLEDRYYRFEYMRMWWPMQDYFGLTTDRVLNAFSFDPNNTQASEIRRGMFDIWWSRDYDRYGEAVGGDYSLRNWPVSERLYFYVRKDIAAQVWNLGVGDGTAFTSADALNEVNVCTSNWQQRYADRVFDASALPEGRLNTPLDIDISADGRVFVAEEFANRISVFDPEGMYLYSLDNTTLEQALERPNALDIAPNGTLNIADTWHYQIKQFTDQGVFINGWGQPITMGFDVPLEPLDGLWGPRDVVSDSFGNIYVSDTGNKRVRVYDPNGSWLRDIGTGGSGDGQLDEPAGLAVSPDGRLYVADTWNRRISVFDLTGVPLFNFRVRGWYEDLGKRPYLAIDAARNLIYVTDPNAGRILVYDLNGNCMGSFGQPTDNPVDGSQFRAASGIAVDAAGNVYVSDSDAGRVLRFAPFTDGAAMMPQPPPGVSSGGQNFLEVTPEVAVDTGVEITPEATPDVRG
jgi:uncharacterized protein (TIGR03663 family)